MLVWSALSPQEQCVLLAAGESSLLIETLWTWAPGIDWEVESPLPYITELAPAVVSLAGAGLISAYLDGGDTPVPTSHVAEAIADPNTWVPEREGGHRVELATTVTGGEVLSGAGDVYSFRGHGSS